MKKDKFDIKGMTCASCQAHVDKAVRKLAGVKEVNVNLLLNSMEVDYDEDKCDISSIEDAVKHAGYEAIATNKSAKDKKVTLNKNSFDYDLLKLIIAFVFLILLMYVAMGHMIGIPLPPFLDGNENALLFALAQLLLTTPILLIYQRYFISGFKKLFTLKPNMDSLIALGSAASLIYGIYAIFRMSYALGHGDMATVEIHRHNLYFESAATILTLVSLGKYFEKISKKRTTASIEKLVNLVPKEATLLLEGKESKIKVDDIKIGDILIIKKGDILPIDGEIINGKGDLEESNITGESLPKFKEKNDKVYAGTTLINGYLEVKTTKDAQNSTLNTIINLVNEAANSKAPISKLVDKISLYFVPTIIGIALVVFAAFMIARYPFEDALNFAISVLVIACPCALGLATPVAIMVASGKGASLGLLIKNAEILEKAHLIKTVVFDKTGTLTSGKMQVTDFIKIKDEKYLEDIIYSLERKSEHPLAQAICNYFQDKNLIENIVNYQSIDGKGVLGEINGDRYQIGNHRLLKNINGKIKENYDRLSNDGKTTLFVIKNDEIISLIALQDIIKETSLEAIRELKKRHIRVIMLTGDNKLVANSIAKSAGIDEVIAEVLPSDKSKIIETLKSDKKHLVAMVGDGVNDAIALTSADLGIAIGSGSDVAIDSSDIILKRNDLRDVINVIDLSKRTLLTIAINLFWAFFYNCIGIIIAAGVFYPSFGLKLSPMIGSLAMSFSSVFVVLNALTLNLFKIKNKEERKNKKMEEIVLEISGMSCMHCVRHVEDALKGVKGVKDVSVSLEKKNAVIHGTNLNKEALIDAVNKDGYQAK